MPMEDEQRDATTKRSFRDAMSQFSLGSKSKYFYPDRINSLPVLNGEAESTDIDLDLDEAEEPQANDSGRPTSKKRNVSEVSGSSKLPSKKRPSRPYAPPETYAHLAHLPDYLKDNLDSKLGSYP
jgi:hypothetical protein